MAIDLEKLNTVIEDDRRSTSVFRDNLVEHVREFVGSHYSENGSEGDNPVNLLSLYVRIVGDYLVGAEPRMMCSTFTRAYKPYSTTMEEWGNRQLVKMGFTDTLKTAINDGIFLMGIVKTSLTAPAEARFGGYEKQAGDISISNIDFEDFIFDTQAKKFSECDYMGHDYDVFLEDVKKSSLYKKKARLKLVAKDDSPFTDTGEEKIGQIGMGGAPTHEPFEEKVRLREVWLRRQNVVVTYDPADPAAGPLLVQKWIGPPCGPYKILSFGEVIGNLMPKAPIMDLIDMHKSYNTLHCKIDDQANRAKKITLYRDATDAKKVKDSKDGDMVQSEDPSKTVEVALGGPDANVANWAMQSYNLYTEYAGGLKSLGGLASQSDTATQEKLVHESASNLIRALGTRVLKFSQELMEGIGWYWWMSPRHVMKTTYEVPGLPDMAVDKTVTPFDRFGIPYDEIDIQMNPYSLLRQTPQMKMAGLEKMLKEVFIPMLPLFNQHGVSDLLAEYVKLVAHYSNNDDFNVLLERLIGVGPPPEGQSAVPEPGMPSETTRNYVRTSQPGMTEDGQRQVLQNLMAGGEQVAGTGADGLGQMRAG